MVCVYPVNKNISPQRRKERKERKEKISKVNGKNPDTDFLSLHDLPVIVFTCDFSALFASLR
jgi:hypothetical protein